MAHSIRQTILKMLSERNTYLSGQEISEKLGVTRTSIWKHIQKLRDKGYQIESVTNLGYRLTNTPNRLIPEEIHRNLKTTLLGKEIVFFETIDSTNTQAKLKALEYPAGTIFIANTQTGGRGRLGRQWSSEPGRGIWCTVLLKPTLRPTVASQFPLLTAVAIAQTLCKYGVEARIKWPNDILVHGRKICGILTEMGAELDRMNYLVIGFGLNVKQQMLDFPTELHSIATSVEMEVGEQVDRVQLICDILLELEQKYFQFLTEGFLPILRLWKEYNCTLGKMTRVSRFNQPPLYGEAIDLTPNGALVLKIATGQLITVFSGEIENNTQ